MKTHDSPGFSDSHRSAQEQIVGPTDQVLKTEYFTDYPAVKAAISTGSVFSYELMRYVCMEVPFFCQFAEYLPDLLLVLLGMMSLDMFTGVLASRSEGERVTSHRAGDGVRRKLAILSVVAASLLLEGFFVTRGLPIGGILYRATAGWFIGVEAISLYENAERLGVSIPGPMRKAVEYVLSKDSHDKEKLPNDAE